MSTWHFIYLATNSSLHETAQGLYDFMGYKFEVNRDDASGLAVTSINKFTSPELYCTLNYGNRLGSELSIYNVNTTQEIVINDDNEDIASKMVAHWLNRHTTDLAYFYYGEPFPSVIQRDSVIIVDKITSESSVFEPITEILTKSFEVEDLQGQWRNRRKS